MKRDLVYNNNIEVAKSYIYDQLRNSVYLMQSFCNNLLKENDYL